MKSGIQDVTATFVNQSWKIVSGPIILLLIPLYLTSAEQGYWYTFTSLAALSVFADLGFGAIVLQFAAHEFAELRFDENNVIIGDRAHIQKLASFFQFVIKWGLKITLCAFPLICVGGYIFLSIQNGQSAVKWQESWLIYSSMSAVVFFNNIILTFFEGCNSVAKLQAIRFRMSVCASIVTILCLLAGWGMNALALSICMNGICGSFYLLKNFGISIRQLWEIAKNQHYNWWPEFSALMWRYALSWCSGYFSLSIYTPLSFYYFGTEAAGKVGLSMAMWTAGFGIAACWMTAAVPRLNILVENKNWDALDQLFHQCFIRSGITMILGGIGFLGIYVEFGTSVPIFQRILNLTGMMILFLCWAGQLLVNNWAIYLRAHKKEPLVKYSVVSSLGVFIITLICAHVVSVDYLFLGFLAGVIIGMPFVWKMYKDQRLAHFAMNGK